MKLDKKIQRPVAVFHVREDEEDIIRNMNNLILNKKQRLDLPSWDKSVMELETAANSHLGKSFLGGKDNRLGKEASLFLNPQVESFLSVTNNTTTLNATATFPEQGQPFLDQSLFNEEP